MLSLVGRRMPRGSVPRVCQRLKIFWQILCVPGLSRVRHRPSQHGLERMRHCPDGFVLRSPAAAVDRSRATIWPRSDSSACCRIESWSGLSPTRSQDGSQHWRDPCAHTGRTDDRKAALVASQAWHEVLSPLTASGKPKNCAQSPRKSERMVSAM